MNEFNVIRYLDDIKLKNILALIKMPQSNGTSINKYLFQAIDESNEYVTGYVDVLANQIIINYKEKDIEHLFSSKITLYTTDNYTVTTEHSIINSKNQKILVDKKIGKNIDKKNIFSFIPKKPKTKKKNLVLY